MAGLVSMASKPVLLAVTLLVLVIALLGRPVSADVLESSRLATEDFSFSSYEAAEASEVEAANKGRLLVEGADVDTEDEDVAGHQAMALEMNEEVSELEGGSHKRQLRDVYACHKNRQMRQVCTYLKTSNYKCCKGKCTFVRSDNQNCGSCGNVCTNKAFRTRWNLSKNYPLKMHCCLGRCVNLMKNRWNCGKCFKKCKKGGECVKGMCTNNY